MRQPGKLRWKALAAALLALLALAGFGLVAYVEALRAEVQVGDAAARVEAAGRFRAGLVANLVQAAGAGSWLGPERRTTLREAAARAAEARLAREVLGQRAALDGFVRAQDELTAALDGIWPALQGQGSRAAAAEAADLRASLARAADSLAAEIDGLEHSLESYHAGSIATAVAGAELGSAPGPAVPRRTTPD